MWGKLRRRLGRWEEVGSGGSEGTPPADVEDEIRTAVKAYREVHGEKPHREHFEAEYGEWLYRARIHRGDDELTFYRTPNAPVWRRVAYGTAGVLEDAVEALGSEGERHRAGVAVLSVFALFLGVALVAQVAGLGFAGGQSSDGVANDTADGVTNATGSTDPFLDPSFLLSEGETERLLFERTNEVRKDNGVNRTSYVPALAERARAHAENMARNDYVGHTTPSGENVGERYGGSCEARTYGENAVSSPFGERLKDWGNVTLEDEEDVAGFFVRAWMGSEGHRETLLDAEYDGTGVGVHVRDDGTVFAVQAFC